MKKMSKEMLEAFRILEEEKHINKDDIIDAVKESLKSAYKRRYGQSESCVIEFDDKKGDFKVYTVREVVEEVFDNVIKEKNLLLPIYVVNTMEDAVLKAREISKEGDIVTLSPACASFDMYPNFEVRGRAFKDIINKLQ